jgi:uncharacterized protein (DUF885 family)
MGRSIALAFIAVVASAVLPLACASRSGAPPPSPPRSTPPAASAAALASPPAALPALDPPDPDVEAAARTYLDLLVDASPETATSLGVHARDRDLDDRTLAHEARVIEREDKLLADVRARFSIGPTPSGRAVPAGGGRALAPAARTDVDLLTSALAVDLARRRSERRLVRDPTSYTAPLEALFLMVANEYAPAADRARDILARLEKVPAVLALGQKNLERPPRTWLLVGVEESISAAAFLDELQRFVDAALPGERARTAHAIAATKAAFAAYRTHLERRLLPRAQDDFAFGRAHFDELLHEGYFLEEDADGMRRMGQDVFEETYGKMTALARRLDPAAAGWPEVVRRIKGRHPTAEELLPTYRREVARARAFLVAKDAVPFPPGDEVAVVETPAFLRNTTTAAYDQPPPLSPQTRGLFYVTPVDARLPAAEQEPRLREHDYGDVVNTAVHEAYPGHHLQLSWSRRHPSLMRKVFHPSILSEGWALYAEELMAELGYYTDEERLMQLEWTLVRAARVMIDVDLHTRGMSYESAVRFLTDEVHLERPLAESEVKRYTLTPTQPLSYVAGRQALFRLRDRYREKQACHFSLKEFHAQVLLRGTVPPRLLEREILAGGV